MIDALEPKPYVKNAADPEQVREASGKANRGRDRELNDVRYLLSTMEGKRFIWRYLGICRLFETSFRMSAEMAYFEGIRSVGLKMMSDITEANPQAFIDMMKEAGDAAKKLQ